MTRSCRLSVVKDAAAFQAQVEIVCQTWRAAPELYFQANTHTVSVDEMPGLEALERVAVTIPMKPGQPKRIEYEYKRHGTLCLIGNWHVVRGQMISPTIKQTRTEEGGRRPDEGFFSRSHRPTTPPHPSPLPPISS